ncbi:MAG: hypothetical protein ACYCU0_15710, partial [Solirubrobacteraceae bacterium]
MACSGSPAERPLSPAPMRWWGWGDRRARAALAPRAFAGLAARLGGGLSPMPPVAFERVEVARSRLSGAARRALE